MLLPELKAALGIKIRRAELSLAGKLGEKAEKIRSGTHAFLWEAFDSICGEKQLVEKDIVLLYQDAPGFSKEDRFIKNLLGLQDQKRLIVLLATIRRGFDPSTLSVELQTKEEKVAQRRHIIFQISRHGGTNQAPIWGTRMFVDGAEKDRDNIFKRLKSGLRILEFINSRALQSRP